MSDMYYIVVIFFVLILDVKVLSWDIFDWYHYGDMTRCLVRRIGWKHYGDIFIFWYLGLIWLVSKLSQKHQCSISSWQWASAFWLLMGFCSFMGRGLPWFDGLWWRVEALSVSVHAWMITCVDSVGTDSFSTRLLHWYLGSNCCRANYNIWGFQRKIICNKLFKVTTSNLFQLWQ